MAATMPACYRVRHDRGYDENPLAAALTLPCEARRALLGAGLRRRQSGPLWAPTSQAGAEDLSAIHDGDGTQEEASQFFDAVHRSVLESYRPRNPLEHLSFDGRRSGFVSAPITLLTWELGGDSSAMRLFDLVHESMPTLIDHLTFNGRPYLSKQFVRLTVRLGATKVLVRTCAQILEATDAAMGVAGSRRLPGFRSLVAMAASTADTGRSGPTIDPPLTSDCSLQEWIGVLRPFATFPFLQSSHSCCPHVLWAGSPAVSP
jgi:hypothetical protein